MQPSPCSSLFNGPVCHFQHLVCIFGGLVGFFVKHVFCCCGHHIFKKCKWWGMPACNLQLAWPQTSDEQANNVLGMPWLPLLGQQPPFASKEVPASSGLGAPQSRLYPAPMDGHALGCPSLARHNGASRANYSMAKQHIVGPQMWCP